MTGKKTPQRKCIACNEMKDKKELLRIVRTPSGSVEPDFSGKADGRGAYICRNIKCFEAALKSKRFERTFGVKISDEVYSSLRAEIEKA